MARDTIAISSIMARWNRRLWTSDHCRASRTTSSRCRNPSSDLVNKKDSTRCGQRPRTPHPPISIVGIPNSVRRLIAWTSGRASSVGHRSRKAFLSISAQVVWPCTLRNQFRPSRSTFTVRRCLCSRNVSPSRAIMQSKRSSSDPREKSRASSEFKWSRIRCRTSRAGGSRVGDDALFALMPNHPPPATAPSRPICIDMSPPG